LGVKPERRKPLENTSIRWKENIKMGIKEIRLEVVDREVRLRIQTNDKLLGSIK
jgi:hypothetical protein